MKAKKKTDTSERDARKRHGKRKQVQTLLREVRKQVKDELKKYSRQVDYDDVFREYYADTQTVNVQAVVLKPPYAPARMYELVEQCPVLAACIESYVHNIHGYGYEVVPIAGATGDLTPAEKKEAELVDEILSDPNGKDSFIKVCKQIQRDYRTTGNGYIEVVRNVAKQPTLFFWADAKRTRICPLPDEYTDVEVSVTRGSTEVKIPYQKKFRKYAMISVDAETGKRTIRWFKEYGDPRYLNAFTGDYADEVQMAEYQRNVQNGVSKPWIEATEIIHLKYGTGTYGNPQWIANLTEVLGMASANYINFDLFENQGIPPVIISIANGQLTEDSLDDLREMLEGTKGAEGFNRFLLLEVESTEESVTPQGGTKETPSKIEVTPMTEYRKEDAMFLKYLEKSEAAVRSYGFRLPNMFVGKTEEINYATARVTRELTEDQVFIPERADFAEILNSTILRDNDIKAVKVQLRNPRVVSMEDLLKLLPELAKQGAFTLNELIDFVNRIFGVELEPYDEEWADLPLSMMNAAAGNAVVPGLEPPPPPSPKIVKVGPDGKEIPEEKPPKVPANGQLPEPGAAPAEKEDEGFDGIDKAYQALLEVQKLAQNYFAINCTHGEHGKKFTLQ